MPCCVLLLNEVVAWPALTTMFTVPPATLRPSRRFSAVPAPDTVTPWPMASVPFDTEMPWPPVFCTTTYASDAVLPTPGETPMPMPDVFDAPSTVTGAAGSGVIAAPAPASWKPATLATFGSPLAVRFTRIGPACVVIATLAGMMIGNVSPASSGTVCPDCPTMTICVPAAAKPPTADSARVTVLKLQLGFATPPTMPLPVAIESLPLIGSTKNLLPVAGEQPVQLLLT